MATDKIDRLINQLNASPTAKADQALWQVILQLIRKIKELQITESAIAAETTASDYVVMSDGITPIPSPVNDGFGNFIYIQYTP